MNEFFKRRVCYWLIQWGILFGAIVAILTGGLVDGIGMRCHGWYLDINTPTDFYKD